MVIIPITCFKLNVSFMGHCLAMLQAPSHWYCGDCIILQQLERQKQVLAHQREQSGEGMLRLRAAVEATSSGNGAIKANGQQEAGSLSQYDAMRQLLLNALSKKAGDPWARQARQVHVAQWAAEELKAKHSEAAEHFLQQVSFTNVMLTIMLTMHIMSLLRIVQRT